VDFDLRQWLLILGPVFIAGVLVHGYLRMRVSQNDIRMKLDKNYLSQSDGDGKSVDDLSLLKAELPNGGARLRGGEVSNETGAVEDVPVLMESVDVPPFSAIEPHVQESLPLETQPLETRELVSDDTFSTNEISASATPASPLSAGPLSANRNDVIKPATSISADPSAAHGRGMGESALTTPQIEAGNSDAPKAPPARKPEEETAESESPKPEKFVVINVLALDQPFAGQPLIDILHAAGMEFGEMNIFHKLSGDGEPDFSLASAVEPGVFNMAGIKGFSTPGVTIFMRVHELTEPLAVLDDLLRVAESIAQELYGEIRDDTRSVMTPQTIDHCRQSIREFQYKHSA
jgi:cell division protein ZipA